MILSWSNQTRYEFACTLAVLAIGGLACVALRHRLRGATIPLLGFFLLAADGKLFWATMTTSCILERLGWWRTLNNSTPLLTIWYYGGHLLPVALAAVFGWAFWAELRKLPPSEGQHCDSSTAS